MPPIRLQRARQIGHMALPCASNNIHSRRCAGGVFRGARLPRTAVQTAHNSIFTTVPIIKPSNSVENAPGHRRADWARYVFTKPVLKQSSASKLAPFSAEVLTLERGPREIRLADLKKPEIQMTKGSAGSIGAPALSELPARKNSGQTNWMVLHFVEVRP